MQLLRSEWMQKIQSRYQACIREGAIRRHGKWLHFDSIAARQIDEVDCLLHHLDETMQSHKLQCTETLDPHMFVMQLRDAHILVVSDDSWFERKYKLNTHRLKKCIKANFNRMKVNQNRELRLYEKEMDDICGGGVDDDIFMHYTPDESEDEDTGSCYDSHCEDEFSTYPEDDSIGRNYASLLEENP